MLHINHIGLDGSTAQPQMTEKTQECKLKENHQGYLMCGTFTDKHLKLGDFMYVGCFKGHLTIAVASLYDIFP